MIQSPERTKIVIVGGGFAGIEVARSLAKSGLAAEVTLVSKASSFQYYPNLYRLMTGATVNQVSIPLEKTVPKNVKIVIDTYTGMDQARKVIMLQSGTELSYDYLVLALGSEPNYFGIEGMEARSRSFLSIEKALSLKQHFDDLLEKAKTLSPEEAKMQLHTIIVGAGPSGVELAGALRPYLARQAKKIGVSPSLIGVDLLDSAPRVLPAIPARASALIAKQLQREGVTIYVNYGVNACDENGLKVTDKNGAVEIQKELHAGTIVWTAGTKISPVFSTIPGVVMTDKKRVTVSPSLTLPTDDRVYIAGDGAGTPFSGLAQTAIDQGKYVGKAIARQMQNKPMLPYEPKQGIFVIPVGTGWAIFNYKEFVFGGFAAWIIRILADARYFLTITSVGHVISMLKKSSAK